MRLDVERLHARQKPSSLTIRVTVEDIPPSSSLSLFDPLNAVRMGDLLQGANSVGRFAPLRSDVSANIAGSCSDWKIAIIIRNNLALFGGDGYSPYTYHGVVTSARKLGSRKGAAILRFRSAERSGNRSSGCKIAFCAMPPFITRNDHGTRSISPWARKPHGRAPRSPPVAPSGRRMDVRRLP
jgi:hypothetical protein